MEQKQRRIYTGDFIERFFIVLQEHWAAIVLMMYRQSPRLSSLLRTATPIDLKRIDGGWYIQIATHFSAQYDRVRPPRDNEIVAQAISLYYYQVAHMQLPPINVNLVEQEQ